MCKLHIFVNTNMCKPIFVTFGRIGARSPCTCPSLLMKPVFGVEQKLKAFHTFLFWKKHYSTSRCRISMPSLAYIDIKRLLSKVTLSTKDWLWLKEFRLWDRAQLTRFGRDLFGDLRRCSTASSVSRPRVEAGVPWVSGWHGKAARPKVAKTQQKILTSSWPSKIIHKM
jgi:hypothetical protein